MAGPLIATSSAEPRPEEWALIEWPRSEDVPTKYSLSTLLKTIPIAELSRLHPPRSPSRRFQGAPGAAI